MCKASDWNRLMTNSRKRIIRIAIILFFLVLIIVGYFIISLSTRSYFTDYVEIKNITIYQYDNGEKHIIESKRQEYVQQILSEILVRNVEKQLVPFTATDMDYMIQCMYKGTAVDVYIGKESFINVVRRHGRTIQYEISNPGEIRQKFLFILEREQVEN